MTSKTILVLDIAAAFVAGTLTSGTAFAKEQPNGQPFQAIKRIMYYKSLNFTRL